MLNERNTPQKRVIFDVLSQMKSHPTAEELYEEIKKRNLDIKVGKATVYRVLSNAARDGVIQKIYTSDPTDRYDAETRFHYHFRCSFCGRVFDLPIENADISEHLPKNDMLLHGFDIRGVNIEYTGACSVCHEEKRARE